MNYKGYLKMAYRLGKMMEDDESMVVNDRGLYVNNRKVKNPSWYLGDKGLVWEDYIHTSYKYLSKVSDLFNTDDTVSSVSIDSQGVSVEYGGHYNKDGVVEFYPSSDIMCLLEECSTVCDVDKGKIIEGEFSDESMHKWLTESSFRVVTMENGIDMSGYVETDIPGKGKVYYSLYLHKSESVIAVCRRWGEFSDCRMYLVVTEYFDEYPLCNWKVECSCLYGVAVLSCPITSKFRNDLAYAFSVFSVIPFKEVKNLITRGTFASEILKGIAPVPLGPYELNHLCNKYLNKSVDSNIPYSVIREAVGRLREYESRCFFALNRVLKIEGIIEYPIYANPPGLYGTPNKALDSLGEDVDILFHSVSVWKLHVE